VRLAVAAGLTGIILWKSDPSAMRRLALAASPAWLLWAVRARALRPRPDGMAMAAAPAAAHR
jgi:hypothetical protein